MDPSLIGKLTNQDFGGEDVLAEWYQVDNLPEWPRANYFKVKTIDNQIYFLKHDIEAEEWFLGKRL